MNITLSKFRKYGLGPAFLFLLLLLSGKELKAQCAQTTEGTEFWVAFMETFSPTSKDLFLIATSEVAATGDVFVGGVLYTSFTVPAGGSTRIDFLPFSDVEVYDSELITNKGVQVITNNPINLYSATYSTFNADATLVFPKPSLGQDHFVTCYTPNTVKVDATLRNSEFIVAATEDNTLVTITPSVVTDGLQPANVSFDVMLDAGEVYQVQSANIIGLGFAAPAVPAGQGDLSGSRVESDKAVAVFSGNFRTTIDNSNTCCWDPLYQQIPPTYTWGSNFITVPYILRDFDIFRIAAAQDLTEITVNGTLVATINAGDFYEFNTSGANNPQVISTSKPVSVTQFSTSQQMDAIPANGDPFMIMLSPIEQTREDITFEAFTSIASPFTYYLNVLTETVNVPNMVLDGAPIPAANFTAIPGTDFSYAQETITAGTHNLNSSGSGIGFHAYVYGFGGFESYGYAAGVSLKPVITFADALGSSLPDDEVDFCDLEGAQDFQVIVDFPGASPTYQWTDLSDNSVVSTSSSFTADNFSSSTEYEVQVSLPSIGCVETDTLSVTFYPVPEAEITHEDSISDVFSFCNDDGLQTLDASNVLNIFPVDYHWVDLSTGDTVSTAPTLDVDHFGTSMDFAVLMKNLDDTSHICINSDTVTVIFHDSPEVEISVDGDDSDTLVFCDDEGAQVMDAAHPSHSPGFIYEWEDLTNSLTLGSASTETAGNLGETTLYKVTVTNPVTGCFAEDSILIVFFAANVSNAGVTSDSFRLCDDDGPQILDAFNPLNGDNVDYQWTDITDPSSPVVVSTTSALSADFYSDTTLLEIRLFDVVTTCEARDTIWVEFRPSPVTEIRSEGSPAPDAFALCEGEVELSAYDPSHIGSVVYEWRRNGTIISTDTAVTASDDFVGTSVYQVTITDTIANCSRTDEVTATFFPPVSARFNTTAKICEGDTLYLEIALTGDLPMSAVFDRYDGGGTLLSSETFTGITSSPLVIPLAETGTYRISELSDPNGCLVSSVQDSAVLEVVPIPEVSISTDDFDNLICDDDSVLFIGSGADNYDFYRNGVLLQSGTDTSYLMNPGILQNGDQLWVVGTITGTDCSDTSEIISPEVFPSPTVDIGIPERFICPTDDSVTITAVLSNAVAGRTYVYDWRRLDSGGGIVSGIGLNEIHVKDTGQYYIVVTMLEEPRCEAVSGTVTVNFKEPPALLLRDTIVCENDAPARLIAKDLVHNNDHIYEWIALEDSSVVGNGQALDVPLGREGLYLVRVTDTVTGCYAEDMAYAGFNVNPDFEISGHESGSCDLPDTLYLMSTNLDSMLITWEGEGLELADDLRSAVVSRSGPVRVTITDTSKSTNCSTVRQVDVRLRVSPETNLNGSDTLRLCESDSFRLNGEMLSHQPATLYRWSHLQTGEVLSENAALTVSYEDLMTYDAVGIMLSVTDSASGCESLDTTFVEFDRSFTLGISFTDTTVCFGESISIEALGTAHELYWSTGDSTKSITLDSLAPGRHIFTLYGSHGNLCGTDSLSAEIFILDTLIAEIPQNEIIVCEDREAVLDGRDPRQPAGRTFEWRHLESDSLLSTEGAFRFPPFEANAQSYNPYRIELLVRDSIYGCEARDTVLIRPIRKAIVRIDSLAPAQLCFGDSALIEAFDAEEYIWNTGDTAKSIMFRADSIGFHTLIVEGRYDTAHCEAASDTFFIEVFPLPEVIAHEFDTVFICAGDSAELQASGAEVYFWSHLPGQPDSSGFVKVSPEHNKTYFVRGINADGCESTDSVHVSLHPRGRLPKSLAACEGEELSIRPDTVFENAEYQWLPSGPSAEEYTVSRSGTYYLRTRISGCEYLDSTTVNFISLPEFRVNDTIFCFDPFDGYGDLVLHLENFERDSTLDYLTLWTDSSGTLVGTADSFLVTSPGTYNIEVVKVSNPECSFTDSVEVKAYCPPRIFVPEAFTPNEDEINPVFRVFGNHIGTFKMNIINRWGEVIYSLKTDDFDAVSPDSWWDGLHNEKPAPDGVYLYEIIYDTKAPEINEGVSSKITGSFLLLR